MKIVDRELYIGASLTQIVECTGFESIKKASATYGHYAVNDSRRLLIRQTKSSNGPWYFTFKDRDLRLIREEIELDKHFYLGLVCGKTATCLIRAEQLVQIIDLDLPEAQSVRVYTRPGSSFNVSGSGGSLAEKIPHLSFPGGIFLD